MDYVFRTEEAMSEKQELKPCPFCGGDEEIIDTVDGKFYIQCTECTTLNVYFRKKDAVNRWNRRAK